MSGLSIFCCSPSFEDWMMQICARERENDRILERECGLDWATPQESEVPPDEICASLVFEWDAYGGA